MIFIETPTFTKQVKALLDDDEYSAFQHHLAQDPDSGALIENTGGLRKVRWAVSGKGKSGGVRVIYYHVSAAAQIRLLLVYPKSKKDTLSANEKKLLRSLIERWK